MSVVLPQRKGEVGNLVGLLLGAATSRGCTCLAEKPPVNSHAHPSEGQRQDNVSPDVKVRPSADFLGQDRDKAEPDDSC